MKELERCWRSAVGTQESYPVRVDLSAVTFIDTDGKVSLVSCSPDQGELPGRVRRNSSGSPFDLGIAHEEARHHAPGLRPPDIS